MRLRCYGRGTVRGSVMYQSKVTRAQAHAGSPIVFSTACAANMCLTCWESHHLCEERECEVCSLAYPTLDELSDLCLTGV